MLYLDSCATTPVHPDVAAVIHEVMGTFYGNPSSIHRLGLEAEQLVTKARRVLADALGVRPGEIVFTSGGTESNNLAIKGAVNANRARGRHLITSAVEHASVYEAFRQLEDEGFHVTYLPVDETGAVRVEDVEKALTDETILVSLMHVNNEVGRIQPIEEVGRLLGARPKVLFHVDAIQSIGKLPVRLSEWGIDLLSGSAHKLEGPKGAGLLYVREGVRLTPLFSGGGQEHGYRSGTENVPLIVGMAKAIRMAMDAQPDNRRKLEQLRAGLVSRLSEMPDVQVSGSGRPEEMAPHLVHFTCPGMKSEVIVHALEQAGIFISTRSACASGESSPSRVLLAMGMDKERAASGLRVSYTASRTAGELARFADELAAVLAKLSPMRPAGAGRSVLQPEGGSAS
ncbi:aminotransferase V [Paenibacillus sp. J31TS4]|uniref:cysteine desulfurase family protein n=1 Tax=Paenibacillus sp. J31TS4 TaxID=2807195 RepID=UPI001B16D91E|nr:cysteine desulfurase family protein [Paenibacillus sp. J31TS4]GIP39634.1 aminotransferase V [Paenibacillus sp. J31TS4]